jgi:predicted acyl esterase
MLLKTAGGFRRDDLGGAKRMARASSVIENGMRIEWDADIEMDDGLLLKADIFRPIEEGRYPVIMSYGPYGKWLHFADGYPSAWNILIKDHPDVSEGTTNSYQSWEVADPEKWVPDGYVCIRVDSRGAGRSPGYIDHWSKREQKDFYDCIEWAARQPWCNGKVGLNGISYYAIMQWLVASHQPPHLAAMCAWEGASDFYRDMTYHGGIPASFLENWFDMQVKTVQHGFGRRGNVSRMTGELTCGPDTVSEADLARNRCALGAEIRAHPLIDDYHRERSADYAKITVPFLSAASWGGQGLHQRSNFEAYVRSASKQKWLSVHGLEHWTHFYTNYGLEMQKRFFGHFLKGENTGWENQPPVQLQVRSPGEKFAVRHEYEWPIARTQWTRFYLDLEAGALSLEPPKAPSRVTFEALGPGMTFLTPPMREPLEFAGPMAARLVVSTTTTDADLFLVVRAFDPNGDEVLFKGTVDPKTPVAQGWLRASHRKLDPGMSLPYRPFHSHDETWPLTPGQPVELDIEIWPSGIVVPPGYRLGLSVLGRDFEHSSTGSRLSNFKNEMKGCGPFLHDDPRGRPREVFGGATTLHSNPGSENYLLLPIIPERRE